MLMEYLQYARNWDSRGDAAGRDSLGWSRKKTYEIIFHVICNPDIAENFFPMEMLSNFYWTTVPQPGIVRNSPPIFCKLL